MQKLFLIALCIVAVNAFACTKDVCSRMRCKAVTACNGRITKGYCGCCDVCIVSLREGERCNPFPFMGIAHPSECGFNLVCSKLTGTCIKPLNLFVGRCEGERFEASSRGLLGAFIPKCSHDGSYAPVQCKGSVCYCVSKEGEEIDGFKGHISSQMNCNCARDQFEYGKKGIIGKMFMCERNGSYRNIQCLGSVCFCADKFGKQIGSTGVPIHKMHSMNC